MALKQSDPAQPDGLKLLTVQQVTKVCGCHPETVYRWIRSGRLTVVNPTREFVIRKEELDKCLTQR